jgi:hypothetical protein
MVADHSKHTSAAHIRAQAAQLIEVEAKHKTFD